THSSAPSFPTRRSSDLASADELHAVVVLGVVAGGDDDAAVHVLVEGGEVHFLGAADADVVHVGTAVQQPARQRFADGRAGQPDVVADDHPLRREEFRIGAADPVSDVFVQLIGNAAAHVVGLEAAQLFGQGSALSTAQDSNRRLCVPG